MPFAICLCESDRTVRTLRWHHSDCTHDCSNSPAKPEENLWIHIFASQIQQAFQQLKLQSITQCLWPQFYGHVECQCVPLLSPSPTQGGRILYWGCRRWRILLAKFDTSKKERKQSCNYLYKPKAKENFSYPLRMNFQNNFWHPPPFLFRKKKYCGYLGK